MPLFHIRSFARSFRYAARGVRYALRHEQSFRVQTFFAIVVTSLVIVFRVARQDAIIVFLLVGAVLTLELLNTALELLLDVVKPRLHYAVELIKDLMAAAVLVVSLLAFLIGLYIFLPYVAQSVSTLGLVPASLQNSHTFAILTAR